MALAMARPWKHPNGTYYLRKRVPKDLQALVGKKLVKLSLGTRDPAKARARHAQENVKLEKKWAVLRAGPQAGSQTGPQAGPRRLTEREAHDLVRYIYDFWIETHRDNPSQQKFWRTDLATKLWTPDPFPWNNSAALRDSVGKTHLEIWCYEQADEVLRFHGLSGDESNRLIVAKATSAAMQRASLKLSRWANGEFDDLSTHEPMPGAARDVRNTGASKTPPTTFEDLFNGWAAERRPAEKTRYEWRRVIQELEGFLGHNDAGRLTADDLIAWKATMVEAGLQPKTI